MSYLFYLDGTLYDNPSEDRDLRTTLKRNSNLNGILVTQDAKVSFTGAAYTYLYDTFFAGLCEEVEVEIWEVCDDYSYFVYGGVIKIADIKIDFQRCKVEASIEDNSFFSYINNNKSIKVRLNEGTRTKTGEVLTVLDEYTITPFDPCVGTLTGSKPGWRVFDVMQYILDYITDNRITLQSDLLSGAGDQFPLFMTNGVSLRTGLSVNLAETELSFQELYEAIQRIYNVAFRFESPSYAYDNAVLRIEKQDYFYKYEGDLILTDVKDLEISSDEDELHSLISIGGGDQDGVTLPGVCPSGVVSTLDSPLFGWQQNTFHLFGQCNNDNELDLTHDFQIASNVIEDVAYRGSLDFDDDLFLIEIQNVDTSALTCDAVVYDYYGSGGPPYYYNLQLNNSFGLQRWDEYLHNSVQSYLSGLTGQFRTSRLSTIVEDLAGNTLTAPSNTNINFWNYNDNQPVPYDDDTTGFNFNIGGNYDIATFQYTCPATGTFSFQHLLNFTPFNIGVTTSFPDVQNRFLYVVVGFENTTTGAKVETANFYSNTNANQSMNASGSLACTSGDVVEAYYRLVFLTDINSIPLQNFGITITDQSYFSCNAAPLSGGVVQTVDTSTFKSLLFKFDYPLDGTTFRDIMDDPTQLITITSNDRTFVGWIDELKYGWEGKAQITLRANAAIQDT